MWRWTSYNQNLKFLQCKLDGLMPSDKEWPHFVLSTWNKDEWEKIVCESCNYVEWEMIDIEVMEQEWEWKKVKKVIITLLDDEWNQIRWRIWYWTTIRKVIQRLSAPNLKEIGLVRFSCWRYSMERDWKTISWNFVAVYVDWQKWDDPYDYEKDIAPRRRAIQDPETWEIVKYNDDWLERWILEDLVPDIKNKLKVMNKWVWSEDNEESKNEEVDAPRENI